MHERKSKEVGGDGMDARLSAWHGQQTCFTVFMHNYSVRRELLLGNLKAYRSAQQSQQKVRPESRWNTAPRSTDAQCDHACAAACSRPRLRWALPEVTPAPVSWLPTLHPCRGSGPRPIRYHYARPWRSRYQQGQWAIACIGLGKSRARRLGIMCAGA